MYKIFLQYVVKWKYKVAEYGYIQVQYKSFNIVLTSLG